MGCLFLVMLVLTGCPSASPPGPSGEVQPSPGQISITMDRVAYRLGDIAEATITNQGEETVLFAFPCDAFLDGRGESGWIPLMEPDCTNLRVRASRLAPGESGAFSLKIEPCPPGALGLHEAFRLRLRHQGTDGQNRTAISPDFSVAPN